MSLAKFAVDRPVLTSMFFLGVTLLGAVSFTRLKVDLLPEIDFPSISVATGYEGAGPEEIETLITRPIERAVSTIEGVDWIGGFSTEGRSRVALRFTWGTDLDTALNDVRANIERVKATLPEEVEPPTIYKFDVNSFPILFLGVSGKLDEPTLRQIAELQLGPRLEQLPGVASVEVRGGLKRQIQILLDTERLRALGLSNQEVVAALRAQNKNVPAGIVDVYDRRLLVRTVGEATQADALRDVVVAIRQDGSGQHRPILLGDVAQVRDTFEEQTNIVRVNGNPGIRLSILKQSGSNTVEVAQTVKAEINKINRDYQGKLELNILTDNSTYIENAISSVQSSVLYGAGLAVLVLLLFLKRLRPTLVVAVGMPISVIGIFTLMYYFNITLNLISFGGVALGIGMLVDNSIVVLENIFFKLEEGLSPREAAIAGTDEVSGAVVASTLTTLVVFVPVIFLTGFASIFFGQMAFVVSFALICSLAVSLTLLPVMSSRFLRASSQDKPSAIADGLERGFRRAEEAFGKIVDWSLRHPVLILGTALVVLVSSFGLTRFIGSELLPEGDESEVRVELEMPTGTRLEVTEASIRKLEQVVADQVPELLAIQTTVGSPGFWSASGQEAGDLLVKLVRPNERTRSSEQIAQALRPHVQGLVPGGEVRVRAGGGLFILRELRGGGERLSVQVRGYELDEADRLVGQVKALMSKTPGISNVQVSRKSGAEEIQIVPDRAKLAALGLRADAVAVQLQTYLQGTRASVFRSDGDEYDVLVRLSDADRATVERVLAAPVALPGGGTIPVSEVVRQQATRGPLTIERENQSRVVTLSAVLSGERDLGSIAAELREGLKKIDHPDSFTLLIKGEYEEQGKTFRSMLIGIALAVLLVYMVMAAQFESYLQPLYIMLSLPFAIVGVLGALALTKTTFNLQSFMGCIVLAGIVVNNAIVLIDYVNLLRREKGMMVKQAVSLAARRRLRPILMTSATTILALIPVAIGGAEGGETQAPLARVVLGGLMVSGSISLVVIPVIYNLIEGRRERRASATASDGAAA
jgi:HAE1 family hydrophobic/amphiphilic exporter-1